jgi:GNAT superfamily N-acetyltransferase
MLIWEITHQPASIDAGVVSEGVFSHSRTLASEGNAQPIACFVREHGTLIAGAVGRTEYQRLFVNSLWVAQARRVQGLGTALLGRLEQEAIAAGCHSSPIETLDDRVARLYTRLGYDTLAIGSAYVGPFNRHVMLKKLTCAVRGWSIV